VLNDEFVAGLTSLVPAHLYHGRISSVRVRLV